jgi:hypothetical protein
MHFRVRILLCLLLLASQVAMAAPAKRKKAKQPPPPEPVQQAPEVPKPPPTPEEMPAVAPHVSMNNGMLTISADNSTMGDILSAVRRQTGAVLELPAGLSSERVATRLGPGTPQSVIQQLFVGSKFDYIIVGSPQDPNALQRIIVTPRGAGGASVASNQPTRPAQAYQPPPEATDTADETPEPEPEQSPLPDPQQQPVTPPTQAQPYSNQPKTPEQLLQELQQMQQQQQQGGRPPRNGGPQAPPQPQ